MNISLIMVYCNDINLNFNHIKALFGNTDKHFNNAFLYMSDTAIYKNIIGHLRNPEKLLKMLMQSEVHRCLPSEGIEENGTVMCIGNSQESSKKAVLEKTGIVMFMDNSQGSNQEGAPISDSGGSRTVNSGPPNPWDPMRMGSILNPQQTGPPNPRDPMRMDSILNPQQTGPTLNNQVAPGPVNPNQVAPGPVNPNQVAPGPVNPNQVAPGPVRSNWTIPLSKGRSVFRVNK